MERQPDPTLTDDEYTVLMIASEGESMMPIGRWQVPVESLVAKGYLRALDTFNNIITTEGRKALGKREDADNAALRSASQQVAIAQSAARTHAAEAAKSLVLAAQASAKATGDDVRTAILSWSREVLNRAMSLANE